MNTVIVGIDLGTTNSVIAVPGIYEGKGEISDNVTVIADDVGRTTQASAVCWVEDHLETGEEAKALAAEGTYTPVRFVKKYMGTQEKFKVGAELWSPEQVSAQVLKHMVGLVDKALAAKVVKAVITHPAYFDSLAINATKEAARLAGLEKETTLVMEPVAAAMAYTHRNAKAKLRVLVYDLGGGTFDITLVDKAGSSFVPIAFGGNRELGGYNFDKKIALRMLAELRAKNYKLDIDSVNPERDPRWMSLLHHAEGVKFTLSEKEKAELRKPGVFKDHSTPPRSVQLNFGLTRKEFEELIEPEIQETLRATWKVLRDANLIKPEEYDVLSAKPDAVDADGAGHILTGIQERLRKEIDHLVLVGGSCRVPAIARRLQSTFGLNPEFSESILDLSVGVGAGLIAQTFGATEDGVSLDRIEEATSAKYVVFAGQVHASPERPDVGNCVVVIRGGRDGETLCTTQPNGKFYAKTALIENCANELVLEISKDDKILYTKTQQVKHDPRLQAAAPPPPPILSKSIAVYTNKGLFVVAPEGSCLVFHEKSAFTMLVETQHFDIRVFQEDIELTTLIVEGLDKPLPAGARLEIDTEIQKDYTMKMTVVAPNFGLKRVFELKLPPLKIPDLEQLHKDFSEAALLYRQALENTPDGKHKVRIAAEGDRLVEETAELLEGDFPERMQIYMNLKKLFLLTKQLSTSTLDPSKREMDRLFAEASALLPDALRKRPEMKSQNFDKVLDALQKQADTAYQNKDPIPWGKTAERVREIIAALTPEKPMPPPGVLKGMVEAAIQRVQEVVTDAEQAGNIKKDQATRYQQELTSAETKLGNIDLNSDHATSDIFTIYQKHVEFVEKAMAVAVGDLSVLAPAK